VLALLRHEGPFRHRNVRLYSWFSMLYNARAYYPVYALLFLTLGLDVREFFLMHIVWAGAIILLEVPSGALADTVVRNFVTIVAKYYEMISIPEWSFGFIGAATAGIGFFVPALAKRAADRFSTMTNLALFAAVVLACLLAVIPAVPFLGLVPVMIVFASFGWLDFLTSRTLNRLADSSRRATVLSVKGLAYNLAYGGLALLYAGVVGHFRTLEGSGRGSPPPRPSVAGRMVRRLHDRFLRGIRARGSATVGVLECGPSVAGYATGVVHG